MHNHCCVEYPHHIHDHVVKLQTWLVQTTKTFVARESSWKNDNDHKTMRAAYACTVLLHINGITYQYHVSRSRTASHIHLPH